MDNEPIPHEDPKETVLRAIESECCMTRSAVTDVENRLKEILRSLPSGQPVTVLDLIPIERALAALSANIEASTSNAARIAERQISKIVECETNRSQQFARITDLFKEPVNAIRALGNQLEALSHNTAVLCNHHESHSFRLGVIVTFVLVDSIALGWWLFRHW